MAEIQSLRFSFYKITTDEFALTGEKYDPALNAEMSIGLGFNAMIEEKVVIIQVKCLFYQHGKLLIVIAVSCAFKVEDEDWNKIYHEENKSFELARHLALHMTSLTVGTARGVLHAKTEKRQTA